MLRFTIPFLYFTTISAAAYGQCPFQIQPRQSFYTYETKVDILLIAESDCPEKQQVTVFCNGQKYFDEWIAGTTANDLYHFTIPEALADTVLFTIAYGGSLYFDKKVSIPRLPHKANAVKIDYQTNSLIAGDLPFFPMGFYCYSPVQPTLPEEEAVRGFNVMSPYQRIEDSTLPQRKAYMDRCAALGMKVHYNVLSVAGGGGVGNGKPSDTNTKLRLLEQEIETFKDHPALLAWYIADEPDGQGVRPESLSVFYQTIKKRDPWHPVSMVFINPEAARKYAGVTDIVMTDPYPIPGGSVLETERTVRQLAQAFRYRKQIWVVPQAFGGGESWQREPTRQEIRAMTWLAVLAGAGGVQYFVRQGLNGFPKSIAAWNECGEMAMEMADLTPFLTSGLPAPIAISTDPAVRVRTFRNHLGQTALVAVHSGPEPTVCSIRFDPIRKQGNIYYPFENRPVEGHTFRIQSHIDGRAPDTLVEELTLLLDGFGTRVIIFDKNGVTTGIFPGNLIIDPGFERNENPGIPSACYLRTGLDRGATAFTDTRVFREGQRSLKLTTPAPGTGLQVSFYPVRIDPGITYSVSFWAKSDRDTGRLRVDAGAGRWWEVAIGPEWKWCEWLYTPDSGNGPRTLSFALSLVSAGTAWIDVFQAAPTPMFFYNTDIFHPHTHVQIEHRVPGSEIYVGIGDSLPRLYTGPLFLKESHRLTVITRRDGVETGRTTRDIYTHCRKPVQVATSAACSPKYHGGGNNGLFNGILGQRFGDGCWQGFTAKEWHAIVDMGVEDDFGQVAIHFLQDPQHWIYAPSEVTFSISSDGQQYRRVKSIPYEQHKYSVLSTIVPFGAKIGQPFRYLKVTAKNIGKNPPDHPSPGGNTWIFADEILVSESVAKK